MKELGQEYSSYAQIQKTIDTTSSVLALTEDDIIIIVDKPLVKNKSHMLEIIDALEVLCDGNKKACIHDPTDLKGLEKGVRKMLKPHINQKFTHIAILNPSPISNVILAFMLKVDGIKIKHKAFATKDKAFQWLRIHQENSKIKNNDTALK